MTPSDEHERETGGDDALATEYVLGVLASRQRREVARRIETDPEFARLVDGWEARLAPLASDYAEVAPPASVKDRIDRTLFADTDQARARAGIWNSLAFWRGIAAVALGALIIYAAAVQFGPPGDAPTTQLVASLGADDSEVRFVVVYDQARHRLGLSHVSGARAARRDFELWLIEGDSPPVSLGVIPVGEAVHLPVSDSERPHLGPDTVLAISLEPPGGSPSGQPTGPVVASGAVRRL